MTKINRVIYTPAILYDWFGLNFPSKPNALFTFRFYWYWGGKNNRTKIYGCEVYKNREYFHNATQAPLSWYKQMQKIY